jgi:pimeloyl-ACP methyl ester carboxylesterase
VEFQIQYARSGDLYIAYEVIGHAPLDLLYVTSYESTPTLDNWTAEPMVARWVERLASFSRLILMDIRGTGLSDRRAGVLEDGVDDVLAVLTRLGRSGLVCSGSLPTRRSSQCTRPPIRIVRRGSSWYGAAALNPTLRLEEAGGFTPPELEAAVDEMILSDHATGNNLGRFAPSLAHDPRFRQWWIRKDVTFSSPGDARAALMIMMQEADVRPIFPTIQVPTLVVHRREDGSGSVENSRYIAAQIPRAKLVELPGSDTAAYAGDAESLAGEIGEFFTGVRRPTDADRVLATVLFTDIARSTERAAELGDSAWKQQLEAHNERARVQIERHRGRWINTTGGGVLAIFDGPGRAVRCAQAIGGGMHELGIDSTSEPGVTRVRSSSSDQTCGGSRCTSLPAWPPWPAPARCWSRARSGTWSPDPASRSKTVEPTC